MYKKIIIAVLICSSLQKVMGQGLSGSLGNTTISDMMIMSSDRNIKGNSLYESIEGSPYLNGDFQSATIHFKIGNPLEKVLIRINAFANELEFKVDNTVFALGDYHIIDYIIVEREKKKYYPVRVANMFEGQPKLMEEIASNDSVFLLKAALITYEEERPAINSYSGATSAKFIEEDAVLYVKLKDYDPVRVDRRTIKKLTFPYTFIAEYVIEENLRPRKEEDFIAVINGL